MYEFHENQYEHSFHVFQKSIVKKKFFFFDVI